MIKTKFFIEKLLQYTKPVSIINIVVQRIEPDNAELNKKDSTKLTEKTKRVHGTNKDSLNSFY